MQKESNTERSHKGNTDRSRLSRSEAHQRGKLIEGGKRDQAATLRAQRFSSAKKMQGITRVISFTSGKGGVGKTHTVVNCGIALAREGKSVLILDADLGLANVNVMLGLEPKATLFDVFEGRKTLSEIIVSGPEGIAFIPSASGIERMSDLSPEQKLLLLDQIEDVAHQYDYLLIDTGAGISSEVMYFNSASSEIVLVITNEPTSLTDAYAMVKVLSQSYGEKRISIVANNVASEREGQAAFERLARAVTRFLHVELRYLGCIPTDGLVRESIVTQRPVVEQFPSSAAGRALSALSRRIDADFVNLRTKGGMQFFFRQLLEAEVLGGH